MPLWLNEGEAEVFSTLTPVGKKVRVGDLLPGRLLELRDAKWLDLETLCAVEHDSPYYNEKDKQRIFYAESWALTHMLVLDDKYRVSLPEFLHQIHAGAAQSDAFHTAFGKYPWEIWQDLQAYVRRDRFNVAIYDVTLEKSAEAPEIRSATPLEIGLVLAGILANIPQKHDEARQAYEKLAIDFPAAPEIPEALGYLAWRSQKPDEARAQFAKAVELGSKNARLYYDYAGLAGNEPERRIPLLRKAVELDPEFRRRSPRARLCADGGGGLQRRARILRRNEEGRAERGVPVFSRGRVCPIPLRRQRRSAPRRRARRRVRPESRREGRYRATDRSD